MAARDIIVIGASAGGVGAISEVVSGLPADLPAAVFVVLHIPASGPSYLPRILGRHSMLPVVHAVDGETIVNGRVYVAPPNCHLLLSVDAVRLGTGPREHGHRPSIDMLFRSAAAAYGPRVVTVVLSGTLDDGTAGTQAAKSQGAVSVVQDPDDALYAGMPRSAIDRDTPDYVLPVAEIAKVLVSLARGETSPERGPTETGGPGCDPKAHLEAEIDWSGADLDADSPEEPPFGRPSGFSCPECNGVLWEIPAAQIPRFRCRVGHGYGAASLLSEQGAAVEVAMWTAVRVLEERAALTRRLAAYARRRDHPHSATRFERQALEAQHRADLLRDVLRRLEPLDDTYPEEAGEPPGG